MGPPRVAVSRLLIIRELHLNLIIELDVASGDLVVYLSQFLEKPLIGGGLGDFGFNSHLLSPQTLDNNNNNNFTSRLSSIRSLVALTLTACLFCMYGLRVGRLGESDLLSAGPFLGSFIAILGTNVGSHFPHRGSEHIPIFALIG